jgi:hypothetical protein
MQNRPISVPGCKDLKSISLTVHLSQTTDN